jgi:hypothetical protein
MSASVSALAAFLISAHSSSGVAGNHGVAVSCEFATVAFSDDFATALARATVAL